MHRSSCVKDKIVVVLRAVITTIVLVLVIVFVFRMHGIYHLSDQNGINGYLPEQYTNSFVSLLPSHSMTKISTSRRLYSTISQPVVDNQPEYSGLNRSICMDKYGQRRLLPKNRTSNPLPPMLYTFPGSGNTWCRLLIDYATGVMSGSVYQDKSLKYLLPGEPYCSRRSSVVKVHPFSHSAVELRTGRFQSNGNKCQRGGVDKFERAILIVRNPFNAIWSEYQRLVSRGNHVHILTRDNFNLTHWNGVALKLASDYAKMWNPHYLDLEAHLDPLNILYIKYENLVVKSVATRIEELRRIAAFIQLNDPSDEQLHCSFILSENPQAHRKANLSALHIDGLPANTSAAGSDTVRITDVYSKQLINTMWSKFGTYVERFGYATNWVE